jgi:hypothetical protein
MGKRGKKKRQRANAAGVGDATVPKIKCKPCGKEWENVGQYMVDKGCPNCDCPHKKNRQQRPALTAPAREARVDRFEEHVPTEESFEVEKPAYFLDVPKVIALEIFPVGCRAKRRKG